jgi:membrane protein YdbS with pleckstrin-like domain
MKSEIADGVDRQLDPRVISLEKTAGRIVTACIAAGSLVTLIGARVANELSGLALLALAFPWAVIMGALVLHTQRWPLIQYRHASYRVDEEGIEIRRGVYWRQVINVPRSRVQHTDVSQGPLERRYGLGTLVIHTAGTDHARVALGGLDHAIALRIREHLLPRERSDAV